MAVRWSRHIVDDKAVFWFSVKMKVVEFA